MNAFGFRMNPYHDEKGRFTTADNAVERITDPRGKEKIPLGDKANYEALLSRLNAPADKGGGGFTWEGIQGRVVIGNSKILSPYPERSKVFKKIKEMKPNDLADYAIANFDIIQQPNHFFGAWHDDNTGEVFLDVSVVTTTHADARRLCKENDQRAYYDLKTGKTVMVDKDAKSGQRSRYGENQENYWSLWQADDGPNRGNVPDTHGPRGYRRGTEGSRENFASPLMRALHGTAAGTMLCALRFNPYHDEKGRFATSEGGGASGDSEILNEATTPPPAGKLVKQSNIRTDLNNDGVDDQARVGVDAFAPPPQNVPRLESLSAIERTVESNFADWYESDPQRAIDDYNKMRLDPKNPHPNTFETDAAKFLDPMWSGEGQSEEDTLAYRSTMNLALHQTANLIVKTAFLGELDRISKLPPDQRSVLVTSGGCGVGKGYCLSKVNQMTSAASKASAIWDAAGDQNATENPWIMQECEKRGIRPTFVYVHRNDVENVWSDPERGIFERAKKQGRMIDARVFADSYVLGARNFDAFKEANKSKADFLIISNDPKAGPRVIADLPKSAMRRSRKQLVNFATTSIRKAKGVSGAIVRGALRGAAVWPGDDDRNGD